MERLGLIRNEKMRQYHRGNTLLVKCVERLERDVDRLWPNSQDPRDSQTLRFAETLRFIDPKHWDGLSGLQPGSRLAIASRFAAI